MTLFFDVWPDLRKIFYETFIFYLFFVLLFITIFLFGFLLAKYIRLFLDYKKELDKKKEQFIQEMNRKMEWLKNLSGDEFKNYLKKFLNEYNLSLEDIYKKVIGEDKKIIEDFVYKDIYTPKTEAIIKSYLDFLKEKIYANFMK